MSQISNIFIRSMDISDLDSVVRIEGLSFPQPWTRDQFLTELQRGPVSHCHVAVMKDSEDTKTGNDHPPGAESAVGFIMAWLVEDELHISNLAVAPEMRRCGIAAALLEESISSGAGMGAVWCQLEVRASNSPARELYKRLGFKPLGKRKGYYCNGEDALVMGKELREGTETKT
jgi:ribosomal-protein-alanine N-acetyltransferase